MIQVIRNAFLLLAIPLACFSQPIQEINFNYLYSPKEAFTFQIKSYQQGNQVGIYYALKLRDLTEDILHYKIVFETRNTLSQKESFPLNRENMGSVSLSSDKQHISGYFTLNKNMAPPFLVARIVNVEKKRAWLYYTAIDVTGPFNAFISQDGLPVTLSYVEAGAPVKVTGLSFPALSITYFSHDFPPAVPPFTVETTRVSKTMKTDSVFTVHSDSTFYPRKKGLYLVQKDTLAKEGYAFRAEPDYPKFKKVQSLTGPMIYICTRQEYERLTQGKGDKKSFDKVILNIIGDRERASVFMRSYFRRVELANQFFTSYKEGWKTDRGMIFIVFGIPDGVYRLKDSETWVYNNIVKADFTFTKSSSLFDPENYILIRDKKLQEKWYEMVDLWRKARFDDQR